MALNKKTKIIFISIIAVVILACIAIGIVVYKNMTDSLYSGDGIYYSQQEDGKYLQFNQDNTFSYVTKTDENTEEMSNGTWSQEENKITLTYTESRNTFTFAETDDGYIYREDTVFRGITSDEKLLKNRYVLEKDGIIVEEMWFFEDGTMDYKIIGDSGISYGTYTRVNDILIVRYEENPDVAHRYLVLDNGISKDIFHKNPVVKAAE